MPTPTTEVETVRLQTIEDAADALGVHVDTLRRWVRNGCPHDGDAKSGYRVKDTEVSAWMRSVGKSGNPGARGRAMDRYTEPSPLVLALLSELGARRVAAAQVAGALRVMSADLAPKLAGARVELIQAALEFVGGELGKVLDYDPDAPPVHGLTADETAELFGITRETLDEYVRAGCPHTAA